MIGNPVSSILPGMTGRAAAGRAPARRPDEAAGRAAMTAVLSAGPRRGGPVTDTGPIDEVLPHIDTPAVLTRPGYTARVIIAAMEQTGDGHGGRVTRLRLDAMIPLSDGPREPAANRAA